MEFLPELRLGWSNGWVYLVFFYSLFGLFLLTCPKPIIKKLYSVKGWSRREYIFSALGKPFSLVILGLIVFSSLKFSVFVFWFGSAVYLAGFIIMFIALFTYRTVPADQPVQAGIYQLSRNPQWLGLVLMFAGTCVACGNGLALLFFSVGIVFYHFRILGEERACLKSYGQTYKDYCDSVPRYFLF